MSERKPSWLNAFAPKGNPAKVIPVQCGGCTRWTLEQRDYCEYTKYDACLLMGEDVVVAIICKRRLVQVSGHGRSLTLREVCGGAGITPTDMYLVEHDCMLPRICERGWRRLESSRVDQDLSFLPHSTPVTHSTDPWASNEEIQLDIEEASTGL